MTSAVRAAAVQELRTRGYSQPSKVRKKKFRAWAEQHVPTYKWYTWVSRLAPIVDQLVHDELPFDVVLGSAPPRSGKTEFWSKLLPPYYLYMHPDRFIGISSYGSKLAERMSRASRARCHVELDPNKQAANEWHTAHGGGMWSAGIGGPVAGFGFQLGLSDDLVKDAEEAFSLAIQERNKDWLESIWMLRREPLFDEQGLPRLHHPMPGMPLAFGNEGERHAVLVSMMTRWHYADATGDLLRLSQGLGLRTLAIHLPAIAEEAEVVAKVYQEYKNVCLWDDPRAVGEALVPERFPLAVLHKLRNGMSSYFWEALFQQRPGARGGGMFPRDLYQTVPSITEPVITRGRGWDKAGTKDGSGAQTAGLRMSIGKSGRIYIEHIVGGRLASLERERLILTTAKADRVHDRRTVQVFEQEPGSGGKDSAEASVRMCGKIGIKAYKQTVSGDKTLRAEGLSGQWQAGNVFLVGQGPTALWHTSFLDEAERFPAGALRDRIDAGSLIYNHLTLRSKPTTGATTPTSGPRYPAFIAVPVGG